MGNKHGKPRGSSSSTPSKAKSVDGVPSSPSYNVNSRPAVPQQHQHFPPPAPAQANMHPTLKNKLSVMDVTAIFEPHEIDAIRKHLASLLGQRDDEPIVITKEEFYRFLGISTSSLYVNRLYAIFDMAGKGAVDFEDLVRGLSVLSQKASREQKLLLSFHLLDTDGKGYITKQTTTELLRSCLAECKEVDIFLSDEQIAQIVDSTFEEADLDNNNVVDLAEYQELDAKHPGLFDFLTVDALGVLNHLERVHSTTTISSE